jgi:hypothetical protein
MDSSETQKPIDYASILAAMEAQYSALGDAIEKLRVLAGVSGPSLEANSHGGVLSAREVPPGAFHGLSIPKAAVLFLKMLKQKQKSSEIAIALRRGGIETRSKDFPNQVHAALDRALKVKGAELMKLHDAYWGLREWLPANVRASMAATASAPRKGKNTGRKIRKSSEIKPKPKPKSKSKANGAAQVKDVAYKAPDPDSTEGRILHAMRQHPAKLWLPDEVSIAAGVPRVQTVHFLLGKMAFRGLVEKTEDGAFRTL